MSMAQRQQDSEKRQAAADGVQRHQQGTLDELAAMAKKYAPVKIIAGAVAAMIAMGVSVGMGFATIKNDIGQLQANQVQARIDSQSLSVAIQNLNLTLRGIDTHLTDSDRRVERLEEKVFGK